jgi:hypothetical protein
MNLVPDHQKHLERHHDFVVFDEVTDNHQDFFDWHGVS